AAGQYTGSDRSENCRSETRDGNRRQRSQMISMFRSTVHLIVTVVCAASIVSFAEEKPVSYYNDVVPILKRSCTGCHHPGKMKGDLDLTTHAAFKKGGKHGPAFKEGDPKSSNIIEEVGGKDPSMPKEGDPLSAAEVAM